MALILPTKRSDVVVKSPRRMVMYAPPKAGKTTVISQLDNCLILDLEDGAGFVNSMRINITSLSAKDDETSLHNVLKEIVEQGKPYKYLALDTITKMEDWCEDFATNMYKATPIGKDFKGKSVLELPQGAGYYWLRQAVSYWLERLYAASERTIIIGHLKEKITQIEGREVSSKDIDLTGKIGKNLCGAVDAVAYLNRNKNKVLLNFQSSEEVTCGSRSEHLKGQNIELTDEKGIADWSKVYID
jgi:hypothetical protein